MHFAAFVVLLCAVHIRAERLPVKIYTAADGLGSSFINSLMRDSHGFLWFATRDGLSRFDGQQFVTYQVGDKNAPPGIEQILETRDGVYWITTTGGLYRYDSRRTADSNQPVPDTEHPTLNAEFISEQRGILFEDSAGVMWLGGDGLYSLSETADKKFTLRKTELGLPPDSSIEFSLNAIAEGRDKSLWAATNWGLLRILPGGGQRVFYQMSNARVDPATDIIEDAAGRVWLARVSQIYVIQPESPEQISGALTLKRLDDAVETTTKNKVVLPNAPGESVKFSDFENFTVSGTGKYLCETSDRHVWLSSGNGAIKFDGSRFEQYTVEQGIIPGGGQIVEDLSGNLWFGRRTGLMRLDRAGLTTYGTADGLKSLSFPVGKSPDSAFYAGDSDYYVSRFDGKRFESVRPALPPDARGVWLSHPVFQTSAGEWWFLTSEKLYRYAATDFAALNNRKATREYTSRDGFSSDLMFRIFEDSRGDLWISNRVGGRTQSGLARWSRAEDKFYFFTPADNLPAGKSVSAFAEDAAGNSWFGFYEGGGLARFADGRFTLFPAAPLTEGVLSALHFDSHGRLWAASSQSGLSLVESAGDELKLTGYTTENGLSSNNVRSIAEDEFGQLYIGTARGVDRISPDLKHIKHYTTNDGLAGDFVHTAFRAADGAMWFGTPNGLSRLVPRREIDVAAPPVWLSSLRVAGENRAVSELGSQTIGNLELAPEQNNLEIEFFGIDFSPNQSLRYQFRLEGADADWSKPTERRTVNYANLSAGSYRFLVRAIGADGAGSQNPAAISFTIARPVWQRWWFLLAAVFLISLAIYALYRYRVAQLLKLERVRTRIATDLHDDIGASLSKISILSEIVNHQIAPIVDKNAEVEKSLTEISGTSREMVDSMSDIVWAINPQRDSLSDLTGRMRNLASEMCELADIGLRFSLSGVEAESNLPLGADLRRDIYLIFKETINNLVKHSNCERVEIEFRLEAHEFIFIVKDDGKGFDAASKTNGNGATRGGNGLINMRRRAENLGGEYKIESVAGRGTNVTLRVPLKHGFQNFGLKRFLSR